MSRKARPFSRAKTALQRTAEAIPQAGKPREETRPSVPPKPAPPDMGDWIIGKRH